MASKNIIEVVIKATDKASKKMKGLDSVIKKLGIGAAAAGAAVIASGVVIGKVAYDLAKESANVEKLRKTFDSLSDSIGENSDIMIKDLRVASRGMLNDADLMQASNKLVAMGLADTSEESAKLVEMSTQLGSAMGMTATDSAEAFALMLANQSIPRLDNFGISSGKVRERILELMEAEAGMTRETAFMTATMEEGAKTMKIVGEQGEGAAANMARLKANVDNLKVSIGDRLRPVLETITEKLLEAWDNPEVQQGITDLLDGLEKIIGDEESGVIGVLTALLSKDWERAWEIALGGDASSDDVGKEFSKIDGWFLNLRDWMDRANTDFMNTTKRFGWAIHNVWLGIEVVITNVKLWFANMKNNVLEVMFNLKIGIHNILTDIANIINTVFGTEIKIPDIKIPQSLINAGVELGRLAADAVAARTALGVSSRNLPTVSITGAAYAGPSAPVALTTAQSYHWGRASGGSVSAGGSYLVGERGPEMLTMGGNSGYITPNNKLGGANITIHMHSVVSLSDMANAERVLTPIILSAMRQAV